MDDPAEKTPTDSLSRFEADLKDALDRSTEEPDQDDD
jgi:hypothetical protein